MVLPGFQDAHCHLALGGLRADAVRPVREPRRRGTPAARSRVRRATPDREWVLGGGWSMSDFPGGIPTREQLDAVVADRPVVLHQPRLPRRLGQHAGAGAGRHRPRHPDPAGGRIERDARRAGGMLQEQAMGLVLGLAPEPDADERVAGHAARRRRTTTGLGITACQDAPRRRRTARRPTSGWPVRRADAAGARRTWPGSRPRDDAQLDRAARAPRSAARSGGSTAATSSSSTTAWSRTAPPPCSIPTWTPPARPPASTASTSTSSTTSTRYVAPLRRRRVRRPHPRASATAPCASRWTCCEQAAAANGRRDARHQLAHVQFAHPRRRAPLPRRWA